MFFRKAMSTLALFSAFSASMALAGSNAATIIGGTTVAENDPDGASTVAIITTQPEGQGICTGSLLAGDILVTAAHCVTARNGKTVLPKQLTLIFASNIRSAKRVLINASGVRAHPNYRPSANGVDQNDIAVISFSGGLPPGYRKATLLPSSTSIPNGSPAVLIGFGVTTMAAGGSGEGILRKATVTVSDGRFGKTEILLDQRTGKGACHGDSGGPAFASKNGQLLLWGVTNRGNPVNAPDDCAHFSVYTRITAQAAFINSASRTLRQPISLTAR